MKTLPPGRKHLQVIEDSIKKLEKRGEQLQIEMLEVDIQVEALTEALARYSEESRPIDPFVKHKDPSTCQHAWEPHMWELKNKYCPYCATTTPKE